MALFTNTWPKLLLRSIGFLNLVVSSIGFRSVVIIVSREVQTPVADPHEPYFRAAFFVMSAINIAFLTAIVITGIGLLIGKEKAVAPYTIVVGAFLAYDLLLGFTWLAPDSVGTSIGAAFGVGNLGMAPFEFLLFYVPWAYPVLSVFVLWIARRVLRADRAVQQLA